MGLLKGSTMVKKIRGMLAPSISAASSRESGSEEPIYFLIRMILKTLTR